ncbi:MAG: RsmB/NOP family class I SAM-dependent RNA methyltransferase [Pseudooceanicola sp.]|nr:RsmB/NOP family class I SAM-dependent RNA methyltransferase [Pseudooceanicola sp.]
MTPAARVQAAIECLDRILDGAPAEQVLTGWARGSRFAGSGDRNAVRDHVFDALRARRSLAALGGGDTGRAILLGLLRRDGVDPDSRFTGEPYAPKPLSETERSGGRPPLAGAEAADLPDWLWPRFVDSLGADAAAAAQAMQRRAPVHLRVNLLRADTGTALAALERDGIAAERHPAASAALEVTSGARRVRGSRAFLDGLVELQDAASQAVVEMLPLRDGMKVLDFCAGGGGKTLAMAARAKLTLFAHDAASQRLRDLPERARRAGAFVSLAADPAAAGPFDLVLCDVPCSGSGSWRRAPDAKWRLRPEDLDRLRRTQMDILDRASALLADGATLAYATCSVLKQENEDLVRTFVSGAPREISDERRWNVTGGTDGFYAAHLT